jgi:arylsulfatase A-like enzyme
MPSVRSLIVRAGTSFARAYVNEPLCCPSRATILTGKYAQNTRVTENRHRQFYEAGNPASTVAVWPEAAGYRTGLVGKYLNHYPDPAPETYVPPGGGTAGRRASATGPSRTTSPSTRTAGSSGTAPRHAALFPDLAAPRPPSFDEAEILHLPPASMNPPERC